MGMTCADTKYNIERLEQLFVESYQKDIIEMVKEIKNEDFLEQIYYFAKVKYDECKKGR